MGLPKARSLILMFYFDLFYLLDKSYIEKASSFVSFMIGLTKALPDSLILSLITN